MPLRGSEQENTSRRGWVSAAIEEAGTCEAQASDITSKGEPEKDEDNAGGLDYYLGAPAVAGAGANETGDTDGYNEEETLMAHESPLEICCAHNAIFMTSTAGGVNRKPETSPQLMTNEL